MHIALCIQVFFAGPLDMAGWISARVNVLVKTTYGGGVRIRMILMRIRILPFQYTAETDPDADLSFMQIRILLLIKAHSIPFKQLIILNYNLPRM